MRVTRFLPFLFSAALLLWAGGCMNYQLGTMLPPDIETVHVPTVQNRTEEPLLKDEVTRAVLAELQQDGSLRISDEQDADTVLHVELVHYDLQPLSYSDSNRARPNEYRLVLQAVVELVRRDTGKVLVRSGRLEGRSTFELSGDLTAGKRRGLPEASRDLGRKIVSAVTEAWPDE